LVRDGQEVALNDTALSWRGDKFMKLRVVIILILVLAAVAVGAAFSHRSEAVFFDTLPWLTVAAACLGFVLGVTRALLKDKEDISDGEVNRHGGGSFLEHWGTALGIFVLLASGFLLGFLFFPSIMKNLDTTALPLNIHFIGVVITLFGGFFFVGDYIFSKKYDRLIPNIPDIFGGFIGKYFLRRKWFSEDKYLSSQKVAFLGFALFGGVLLISGAVKVAAHVWPINADYWAFFTVLHDLFSLLFIFLLVVHVLLVLGLREWPALISWITGKVTEKRAKEDYPVWHEELKTGKRRGYKLRGYKEASKVEE
jgi:cytochrome b subunit of formate dehydrogenase